MLASDQTGKHHRHLSSEEKKRIVLRVLGGEPREAVARDSNVSLERIESWESKFVAAGTKGLSSRRNGWFRSSGRLASVGPWAVLLAILFALVFFLTRLMENGGGGP